MIDKKILKKMITIIALICIIIILIFFIRKVLSRYETNANFNRTLDVAFSIFDGSYETEHVALADMTPSETPYQYSFSIKNNKDGKRTEVALQYEITIMATTNMPLEYKLSKDGTDCNISSIIETDSDGTYYKKITATNDATNNFEMGFSEDETDNFILYVTFKSSSTDYQFADRVDDIKITVNAKQKIE